MSIPVNDISEMYAVVVGYDVASKVFDMLTSVGIIYVPFVYMIVKNWLEARASGSNEGTPAIIALKKIEHKMYIMMFVYIFAVVPVNWGGAGGGAGGGAAIKSYTYGCDTRNGIQKAYDNERAGAAPTSEIVQATALNEAGLNGQPVMMPMWWALVQSLTVASGNAVINSLPCELNLRNFSVEASQDIINDENERDIIEAFIKACVADARKRVRASHPTINGDRDKTLEYLSLDSQYMRNKYSEISMVLPDTLMNKKGATYTVATRAWGMMEKSDNKTVSCKDIYEGGGAGALSGFKGVRDYAMDRITNDKTKGYAKVLQVDQTNTDVIHKAYIEKVVANTAVDIDGSGWNYINKVGRDVGDFFMDKSITIASVMMGDSSAIANSKIGKMAVMAGAYAGEIANRVHIIGLRAAQPIILSIITIVFVIALPILLTLSGFSGKALLTLSGFYFALKFTPVIFAVGEWFDRIMIQSMQSDMSKWNMDSSTFAFVSDYVAVAAYEYMPMLWFVIVGLVGIQGGNALGQQFGSSVGKSAGGAGGKTMDATKKAATKAATKGAK